MKLAKEGYSVKKGIGKGLVQLLTAVGALVAFAGFSDIELWSLVEEHLRPTLSGITVGGVVAFAINYVKFNWTS